MSQINLYSACTLVDIDGRILLQSYENPIKNEVDEGQWKFPLSAVKEGVTPELALINQLKLDLNIDVSQSCLAPLTFSRKNYGKLEILVAVYICRRWENMMFPKHGQNTRWMQAKGLRDYDLDKMYDPVITQLIDILP